MALNKVFREQKYLLLLPLLLLGALYLWSAGGPASAPGGANGERSGEHAAGTGDTSGEKGGVDPYFGREIRAPADPDSATLASVSEQARSISSLRSLLVYQKDTPLVERYYRGMSAGRAMNLKSASKSVLSLLIGIAVDRGVIGSVQDSIRRYLPEYFEEIEDERKRSITVQDLLTMRAGLETTSFHNYGRWVVSDDWVEFALEQPMVEEPGGEMVYSTGSSHLLSVILTRASGMSTRTFAMEHLFGPLGIRAGGWDRGPQGYYMGGNNMALRPSDMMKIGRMVLNGGVWEGERIVSRSWLENSFQTYTRSNYNPYDYGYMWWKRSVAGYPVRFAWGYGGQYIFMIPDLDAVVVITSSLSGATQDRRYRRPVFELLRSSIIPMLETGS